jgi:hypothetical protein
MHRPTPPDQKERILCGDWPEPREKAAKAGPESGEIDSVVSTRTAAVFCCPQLLLMDHGAEQLLLRAEQFCVAGRSVGA